MPRHARVPSKSGVYHIMLRGNERKSIFLDGADKDRFVNTLFVKKQAGEYELYAYCVMDNHVHLLMKEGTEPISKSMKKLAVSYAYYFNQKYQRVGHVFQDRYKSENVEDDAYLITAVRYIHNNPVKSGICSLENYPWSSYRLYNEVNPVLPEINTVLHVFSENRLNAIKQFQEFSQTVGDENFLDMEEVRKADIGRDNIGEFIAGFVSEKGIKPQELFNNKELALALIREINSKSNLSLRKIAELVGMNREAVRKLNLCQENRPLDTGGKHGQA